jgi:hypothetical protein
MKNTIELKLPKAPKTRAAFHVDDKLIRLARKTAKIFQREREDIKESDAQKD